MRCSLNGTLQVSAQMCPSLKYVKLEEALDMFGELRVEDSREIFHQNKRLNVSI